MPFTVARSRLWAFLLGVLASLSLPVLAQIGGAGVGGFPRNPTFDALTADTLTADTLTADTLAADSAALSGVAEAGLATSLLISSASPGFMLQETDAAADNGLWRFWSNTEWLRFAVTPDSGAGSVAWLEVNRTGSVVDSVEFSASATIVNTLLQVDHSTPLLVINETDAVADEKLWAAIGSGGQFRLATRTDANGSGADFLTVDRTGTAVNSVSIDGTAVDFNGVDVTAEFGTFEVTWETACTTTPSQTWSYYRIGKLVTVTMEDQVSCTSDSTLMQASTDIPASLRPSATSQSFFTFDGNDNGSQQRACIEIGSNGAVSALEDPGTGVCGNTWTNTGTKGLDVAAARRTMQWLTP